MPADPAISSEINFYSLDGLRLCGTLVVPYDSISNVTVLVHGGGADREEGGFFTRLALGLADVGVPSLRFDFRAHGKSGGRQEDLTLAGVANDIRAAVEYAGETTGRESVNLIGTSFAGGISAFYAARYPDKVHRLVLFNPLLNYKKRFIEDKPYWRDDHISLHAAEELCGQGFIAHSPSFKLGRPLLNEIFFLRPHEELGHVTAPTLIVHGTSDTFIPVESSRTALTEITGAASLIEIDGAQHGFAVHDDPGYLNPQTQEWQAFVIRKVAEWLASAD